ncbi:MAG: CBM9 family sugar-binding protein [Gammaproteobacteria bacterium]|nr:CBM9 family sugar-binding protein [Gammaproteobacteria bacterium]MDH5302693.1 CBM9 family sugar-binding protein [Gammaproteobacteria bacterium]MDH5320871.1 CBM9 family sugar-binding protein [Gammaproteobacteria bacterium]
MIADSTEPHLEGRSKYFAPQAATAPIIDGQVTDSAWSKASWRNIDHGCLGPEFAAKDFSGRYKVVWANDKIFVLAETVDDILFDGRRDPLSRNWDDDRLEVFLDEDISGRNHQYSHNAFAYHLSLDNQAIDIGTDKKGCNYSDHVSSRWRRNGNAASYARISSAWKTYRAGQKTVAGSRPVNSVHCCWRTRHE